MEEYDFLDKSKVFNEAYVSKEMEMWRTKDVNQEQEHILE